MSEQVNSEKLNLQLESVYQWSIDLSTMKLNKAYGILEGMKNTIKSVKNSPQGYRAEKNHKFTEALLVSKILESWIKEQDIILSEHLRQKEEFDSYVRVDESQLDRMSLTKRKEIKNKLIARGLLEDFKKKYGPVRGEQVFHATTTKMVLGEKWNLPSVYDNMLSEGQIDQAAAVMAARDIVDNIQTMIQKLSGIINDDLPSLQDVVRDEIGDEQATSFNTVANDALNPLLTSLRDARQKIDDATRAIASGQMPGAADPMDMGIGSGDETDLMPDLTGGHEGNDEGDDFGTSDVAAGSGNLGRTKR